MYSRIARRGLSTSARTAVTPRDPAPEFLTLTGGRRIRYTREGTGETRLVALHGAPGSVYDFRYIGGCLKEGFEAYRIEQPGHGAVPASAAAGADTEALAAVVREAGDHLGLWDGRSILLAHSAGTHVALRLAAELDVRAVCLICPVSLRPHKGIRPLWLLRGLGNALSIPLIGQYIVAPYLWLMYTQAFGFNSKRLTMAEVCHTQRRIAAFDFAQAAADAAAIRERGTPCMIVWADDDHLLEPEIPEELGDALPPGPRQRFTSGGHFLNKHRAAEIVAEIEGWTSRL